MPARTAKADSCRNTFNHSWHGLWMLRRPVSGMTREVISREETNNAPPKSFAIHSITNYKIRLDGEFSSKESNETPTGFLFLPIVRRL